MEYKKPFSFLFITSDPFPPFRVDITVLFGKEIASRGHIIDWLFQSDKPCSKSYETTWPGGRAWVAKNTVDNGVLNRIRKHVFNLFNDFRVLTLPVRYNYDFIQVKDKFLSAILAVISCKLYRKNFYYWLSYPFPEAWIKQGKERSTKYSILRFTRGVICKFLLYKVILLLAKHIFVQSEQMKKDIAQMGIPKEKVTVVPMGINIEEIPDLQKKTSIAVGNTKVVVFLGIFYKIRRLEFLIRMFKKVLEEVPDAKFYFIGRGEDPSVDKMLNNEAKKLGVGKNIVFTGYIPLYKALEYVRKASVCVSSYYPCFVLNSTSPTKVIEYMAMGKAVVGNDHPEQKLLITESGGGICVPYDEIEFAKAVVKLLRNPEIATEMGQRGKLYVQKYRTYPVIASMLEQAYYKLL